MAFDYKKEYKEFYMPKNKPSIVEIPKMNFIAVRGTGNPNEENGIKRIAIITKNNIETIELYERLKDQLEDINIIQQNSKTGTNIGDLVVLPSYISKGLEFDGVISYTDENNEYQEKDKYLFYVVCTRAQHNLTVYNQKSLKLV